MVIPRRSFALHVGAALVAIAILAPPVAAQRVRQISDFTVNDLGSYAVDDAGTVAFFISDVDPLGTNPHGVFQVFKRGVPGGALTQVTAFDAAARAVTVSDDGATILFVTAADPLGTNTDRSDELFLADANGGSLVQLTDLPAGGGQIGDPGLAGDGASAIFASDADFTGANPSGYFQVFVVDTGGTGISQVTTASSAGDIAGVAISDDGSRIAFVDDRDLSGSNPGGTMELFTILTDGSGLTQITAGADVPSFALSGLGNLIAYTDALDDLYTVNWGSTVSTLRDTLASSPTLTDLGSKLYYSYNGGISIRLFDAKTPPVIEVWSDASAQGPVISGTGNRLLFRLVNDRLPYFSSPYARGLIATDGDGESHEELVDVGEWGTLYPFEMSANGRWIVFPWGWVTWFYLADTVTDQVTDLPYSGENPAISDDGTTIVFNSWYDLLPDECPFSDGWIFSMGSDGSGLVQLAPDPATCNPALFAQHAMIAGDGGKVVFQAATDPTGTDTGGGAELFGVESTGGPITLVTNENGGVFKNPRIDGTGTWAVFHSDTNPTGQNPDYWWQVFRVRMDGTGLEQITTGMGGLKPDISATGERIVYMSRADPLGTNADLNDEIFLFDTTTSSTEQLTVTASGGNTAPRISPNGQYVAFGSTSPWVDSSLGEAVYRIELDSGQLLLASAGEANVVVSLRTNGNIDVSDSGAVAFESYNDLVRRNPDRSSELWLAEFDAAPMLEPGAPDPTVVRWDPLPWALSYDVIRGDVANLSAGMGGMVDLGAVVCVENDSVDATTVRNEDALQPSLGQVLFYVFRSWGGDLVGDGSWGQGSNGNQRIPGGGSCPDGP